MWQEGSGIEGFCGKAVSEIGGSSNGFRLKVYRYMSVKHEGPCYLKKGTVFAFSNPILLWSVGAGGLMNKTMFKKKLLHCNRDIFTTII